MSEREHTPPGPFKVPGPELGRDDYDGRLVRAETLVGVLLVRVDELARRTGRQEQTTVRIETRLAGVEGKLDLVVERLGALPTTVKQAAVTTGVGGGIAVVVAIVREILASTGHG